MRSLLLGLSLAVLFSLPAAGQTPRPDADMQRLLDTLKQFHPKPIDKLSAEEARMQPSDPQAIRALLLEKGLPVTPEPVVSVTDIQIPGPQGSIPARVYTCAGQGIKPMLVYFHGGGWVLGNLTFNDASCRSLCNSGKCIVVSIGYRLAPEHRFPAAPEDCYAATQYLFGQASKMGADPARIAVGGESAGGNLAAVVCMMARDRSGHVPIHQLLIYPVLNYAFDTPSYQRFAAVKTLNKTTMEWFFNKYLSRPAEGRNPYVSPLRGKLAGLPAATIIASEIDPLFSEDKTYYERLRQAGVPAAFRLYTGVTHGFFGDGAVVSKAKAAEEFAGSRLREAFKN